MKIKEIMTPEVEVLSPATSIQEAAAKMKELDVGCLPVCDGERVVGMLTDRDVTTRFVAQGLDFSGTTASDVMTRDVVYCFEDDDVEKAEAVMKQHQIRRLIVLDSQKRLAGIVSLSDIALEHGRAPGGDVLKTVSQPSGSVGAAAAKAAGAAQSAAQSIKSAASGGGKPASARSSRRSKGSGGRKGFDYLVKDELSAVATYRQAIERLGSDPAVDELRRIEKEHEDAAAALQQRCAELGTTPPSSSGAWGAWAKMVEGAASMFGAKPAIKALKEGEEHGISDYEQALEDPGMDERIKSLISVELLPKTRSHVPALDRCIGAPGRGGPGGMSYHSDQGYGPQGQGRGAA